MSARASPATTTNNLQDDLAALVARTPHFLCKSDPDVVALAHEINKLKNSSPQEYFYMRALLACAQGDQPNMMRMLATAEKLGPNIAVLVSKVHLNTYLLCASVAQENLPEYTATMHSYIPDAHLVMPAIGAFQAFEALYRRAEKAGIAFNGEYQLLSARAASEFLRNKGVEDATCAKVIDTAGEVLREHNLTWKAGSTDITVDMDAGTVVLHFKVDTTYKEAFQMLDELHDKLIERDLDTVPLYPMFRGARA